MPHVSNVRRRPLKFAPTPVKKKSVRRLKTAQNIQKAVALRLSGLPVQEIADKLQLTQPRISQMLTAYLQETRERTMLDGEQLLQMELHRLDAIFVAHYGQRKKTGSARVLLQVLERRAKLLGLDAPTKTDLNVSTPMGVLGGSLDLSKLNDIELGWLEIILEKAGPASDPSIVPEVQTRTT